MFTLSFLETRLQLYLTNNTLSGTIPALWNNTLPATLSELMLEQNKLTGEARDGEGLAVRGGRQPAVTGGWHV